MTRYVAHRLLMMVGILFGVLTITFALGRILPGSPVEMMLGAKPTQAQIDEARERLGSGQAAAGAVRPLSQRRRARRLRHQPAQRPARGEGNRDPRRCHRRSSW
ncbi:MAG: hypothetical protein M5U09_13155 [Gammaproteobacteria bacterium]|nr:hypothetical protein [Gammaproteobacteria bacterium]